MLFSPIERACYDRAQLILSVSSPYVVGSKILASLWRSGGRFADRPGARAIPGPGAEVRDRGERLKRAYPGPLWFFCGRLVYYKGIETALLALQYVPGTLLIAGDGPARPQLERLTARLNLKDRARFLGKIPRDEDLAAYYLASDAFWFPSNARSEAYGLVQVEAMASGCPVINTAIPHSGVPWVSRHEETGLTVPVDDPAAFAGAALRLLNEPGLRDRLAAGHGPGRSRNSIAMRWASGRRSSTSVF